MLGKEVMLPLGHSCDGAGLLLLPMHTLTALKLSANFRTPNASLRLAILPAITSRSSLISNMLTGPSSHEAPGQTQEHRPL